MCRRHRKWTALGPTAPWQGKPWASEACAYWRVAAWGDSKFLPQEMGDSHLVARLQSVAVKVEVSAGVGIIRSQFYTLQVDSSEAHAFPVPWFPVPSV